VSWGTREVPQRKTREEIEAEKLAEEEKRKEKNNIWTGETSFDTSSNSTY
jgi:hypothetical protein